MKICKTFCKYHEEVNQGFKKILPMDHLTLIKSKKKEKVEIKTQFKSTKASIINKKSTFYLS